MHFFGLYGTLFFIFGLCSFLFLIIEKIVNDNYGITNKPLFYIALTAMIIGMQLFLAGFIAELIVRNASDRNNYLIEDKIGIV